MLNKKNWSSIEKCLVRELKKKNLVKFLALCADFKFTQPRESAVFFFNAAYFLYLNLFTWCGFAFLKIVSPTAVFFFSVTRWGPGGRQTFKDASPSRCISNYVKKCLTGGKAAAFSTVGSTENTEVCGLRALRVVQRWCWAMAGFKQDHEGARELCVCVFGCVSGWPAVERFIDSWSMPPTHCVRCADVVQWPQYHFQFLQSGQRLW